MNIVAYMLLGNEVELCKSVIAHTLSLGVDAFVVIDTASQDGTAALLSEYRTDPRFDITFLQHEQVYGENFLNLAELDQKVVARARQRFAADWILRLDADEFLVNCGRPLKAICADCSVDQISVPRYNVVARPGQPPLESLAAEGRIAEVAAMVRPFPNEGLRTRTRTRLPLNFSRVGHKSLTRAQALHGFAVGGHNGLDQEGRTLQSRISDELASLHFWFTSEARFVRKSGFIRSIENTVMRDSTLGWQWTRWGGVSRDGAHALNAEFRAQIPSPEQYEILRAQGRVAEGDGIAAAIRAQGTQTPWDDAARIAEDLEALGWDQ